MEKKRLSPCITNYIHIHVYSNIYSNIHIKLTQALFILNTSKRYSLFLKFWFSMKSKPFWGTEPTEALKWIIYIKIVRLEELGKLRGGSFLLHVRCSKMVTTSSAFTSQHPAKCAQAKFFQHWALKGLDSAIHVQCPVCHMILRARTTVA